MDNSDSDEPEKKRPHLNLSFGMARHSASPPDSKTVSFLNSISIYNFNSTCMDGYVIVLVKCNS